MKHCNHIEVLIMECIKKMPKYKKELIIDGYFPGELKYNNSGMRHSDEEEYYGLKKGDKVYIWRLVK